jgi:sec-independent protein translocase protein TatC
MNTQNTMDHFIELRKRILWSGIVFLISMIGSLFAVKHVIAWIKNMNFSHPVIWNAFSPFDAISLYMKLALLLSASITLPFALYQIWMFVKPGLTTDEAKTSIRYIPYSVLLFVIGGLFSSFVVVPLAIQFASALTNEIGLQETYGANQYLSFIFNLVFPMMIAFQLPIVILFLNTIGLITSKSLTRIRKHMYIVLYIAAAIITPPDFLSHFLVAIPLVILFEISIYICYRNERKKLKGGI